MGKLLLKHEEDESSDDMMFAKKGAELLHPDSTISKTGVVQDLRTTKNAFLKLTLVVPYTSSSGVLNLVIQIFTDSDLGVAHRLGHR